MNILKTRTQYGVLSAVLIVCFSLYIALYTTSSADAAYFSLSDDVNIVAEIGIDVTIENVGVKNVESDSQRATVGDTIEVTVGEFAYTYSSPTHFLQVSPGSIATAKIGSPTNFVTVQFEERIIRCEGIHFSQENQAPFCLSFVAYHTITEELPEGPLQLQLIGFEVVHPIIPGGPQALRFNGTLPSDWVTFYSSEEGVQSPGNGIYPPAIVDPAPVNPIPVDPTPPLHNSCDILFEDIPYHLLSDEELMHVVNLMSQLDGLFGMIHVLIQEFDTLDPTN